MLRVNTHLLIKSVNINGLDSSTKKRRLEIKWKNKNHLSVTCVRCEFSATSPRAIPTYLPRHSPP